jgi:hypothetical protein
MCCQTTDLLVLHRPKKSSRNGMTGVGEMKPAVDQGWKIGRNKCEVSGLPAGHQRIFPVQLAVRERKEFSPVYSV